MYALMPEKWKLFVAATAVIAATPGPNMLLVMTTSTRVGLRRSLATMAGCLTGILALMTLSVGGLGAVLSAAPQAFTALRLAGAGYLVYLGAKMWLNPSAAAAHQGLYRQGLLVSLSNPKAILFAAAFLPQFLDPAKPQGPQFLALLCLFAIIEVSCYLTYALGGRQVAALLSRPRFRRAFDRCAGAVFVAFAAALAV